LDDGGNVCNSDKVVPGQWRQPISSAAFLEALAGALELGHAAERGVAPPKSPSSRTTETG
jgi:hypothetical protein